MKKTLKWKIAQKAEKRWWQRYLQHKTPEQYLAWKRSYWQSLYDRFAGLLSLSPGARVIDVGCGPAGIFMILDQYRTTAVDPLTNEYEKLSGNHFRRSRYPGVDFVSLPFEEFETDETFAAVFCMNAINHFSELEKSFDKLCTLPDSAGKIVLTIDAHNFNFFRWLFRLIPGDILHPHQYNLKEYLQMMKKRNFLCTERILLKKDFFFNHYLLIFTHSSPGS